MASGYFPIYFSYQRNWVWKLMEKSVRNSKTSLTILYFCRFCTMQQRGCSSQSYSANIVGTSILMLLPLSLIAAVVHYLRKYGCVVAYSVNRQIIYLFKFAFWRGFNQRTIQKKEMIEEMVINKPWKANKPKKKHTLKYYCL